MSHALKLERWLGQAPGPHGIGQVAVAGSGGSLELRHLDDAEAEGGTLQPVDGLAALRQVVKSDAAGAFRPLRGAPTLRRGWKMEGLSLAALVEALDVIYPTAVASWVAWIEGALEVTEFAETAARQTGMYRIAQVMTAAQLAGTVSAVCTKGCLRRRLWEPEPALRLNSREKGRPPFQTPGEFPLLCPEACNYFVAQARERIVADKKEPGASALRELYDGWWTGTRAAFDEGRASIDPFLAGIVPDPRRGLTLVIKPGAEQAARLAAALEPLSTAELGQYFYAPTELHVTFLSLVSGSPRYQRPDDWDGYLAAVREALRGIPPFGIELRGLTATEEAVMVQGFPEDDALNRARDTFRERFAAAGLAGTLDKRFRAAGAHLTVMRFRQTPRDLPALAARIEALRETPLGRIEVDAVELVESDWYHSGEKTEVLATIPLE